MVPLKGRCSRKWEIPDSSADSYLDPAPTQMTMDTDLVWGMVEVRTRSWLSKTERWYMFNSLVEVRNGNPGSQRLPGGSKVLPGLNVEAAEAGN